MSTAAISCFDSTGIAQQRDDLCTLVRIPSISESPDHKGEVAACAHAVANLMRTRGFENIEVLEVDGAHPYVYADWLHAPGAPTVLLYAHHDVQPVGDLEKWNTAPFDPILNADGTRLFGRGAADDKGGIVVHTAAVAAYLTANGKLPINVRVVIEGEEETGSEHLRNFIEKYKSRIAADAIILTDTSNFATGLPSVTTSLRGLVILQVEAKALKQSVHSGHFGGALPDPAMGLCMALASLVNKDGSIAVPGILDKVRPMTEEELRDIASLPTSDELFREEAGMLDGVEILGGGRAPWASVWRHPAICVNGIQASKKGEMRNVINESAWARVGIRLVPDLEPEDVTRRVTEHIKENLPWGLHLEVSYEPADGPWCTNTTHPAFAAARRALERGYEKAPVFIGSGGSIGFVDPFTQALGGVPALLIGIEDPDTNAHSENESVHLGDLAKATRSVIYLYEELAAAFAAQTPK